MAPRPEQKLPRNFSERVKRLRGGLGLTQSQLAELLGVSFASVNRWENSQSRPSTLTWQRIVAAEQHGLDALLSEPAVRSAEWLDGARPGNVTPLEPDFSGNSEIVRTVSEAHRLAYSYIFNPLLRPKPRISIRCPISG
jgi:transcriptional regulator with XRE-family HTH domain